MKKQTGIISIIGAILLLTSINSYAGTIFVQAGDPREVGDQFEVNLVGQSFAPDLVSFGLDVAWNPAILQLLAVDVPGSIWNVERSDSFSIPPVPIDNTAGVAGPFGGVSSLGPGSIFEAARLVFEATGVGFSPLTLTAANDPTFHWEDVNGDTPSLEFAGDPGVNVVPLPGAAWLFLSGLGLLGVLKKRKRAHVA
jgi:hypothetical protein